MSTTDLGEIAGARNQLRRHMALSDRLESRAADLDCLCVVRCHNAGIALGLGLVACSEDGFYAVETCPVCDGHGAREDRTAIVEAFYALAADDVFDGLTCGVSPADAIAELGVGDPAARRLMLATIARLHEALGWNLIDDAIEAGYERLERRDGVWIGADGSRSALRIPTDGAILLVPRGSRETEEDRSR